VADDAGALLVRSGLIQSDDLAAARSACADVGGTIGEHLVAAGVVGDEALTEFYRSRLLVPQVNPNNLARLAGPIVATIPSDMAVELRVVPVALDRDHNLTVAMSDPSDRHAVDEIAFFTGHYVVRAVATQMQIAWCLAHYYGHVTELGRRLLRPSKGEAAATTTGPVVAARVSAAGAAVAPAANGTPTSMPRTKGVTGRVDAMRHKVRPPTTPVPVAAEPEPPSTAPGDVASTAVGRPALHIDAPPVAPSTPDDAPVITATTTLVGVAPGPRAVRALTVEPLAELARARALDAAVDGAADGDDPGRATRQTAPPVGGAGVPTPVAALDDDDDDDDEPEIQIRELSGPIRRNGHVDTQPTGPSSKRRVQPPELAARAGEVEARVPHEPTGLDLPAVVITDEARPPSVPPVLIETEAGTSEAEPLARPGSEEEQDSVPEAEDEEVVSSEVPAPIDDVESQPILLVTPRRATAEVPADPEIVDVDDDVDDHDDDYDRDDDERYEDEDEDDGEYADDDGANVVLLDRKKPETPPAGRRPERHTQVGVGEVGAPRRRRGMRPDQAITLPMIDVLLTAPPEIPTETDTTVRVPVSLAPDGEARPVPDVVRREPWTAGDLPASPVSPMAPATSTTARVPREPTSGRVASAVGPSSSDNVADGVPRAIADDEDSNTRRVDTRRNRRSSLSMTEIDDGWGPPGSTIPPPFLGAMITAEEAPSSRIPLAADDDLSGPLLVAPPTPPEDRTPRATAPADDGTPPETPAAAMPTAASRPHPVALARDLEAASTHLLELMRQLDSCHTRDGVIELLVKLIAESHAHAAFFAVRGGDLHAFATRPVAPGTGSAALRLDTPSTFQDVVGTRLPYRGPLVDDASRALVLNTFGVEADEVLIIPVAVRDRVVGVVYGAGRERHTFDEHVGLAARAAGLALERILKSKARRTPTG
jgi:hypothetical protein